VAIWVSASASASAPAPAPASVLLVSSLIGIAVDVKVFCLLASEESAVVVVDTMLFCKDGVLVFVFAFVLVLFINKCEE